MKVTTKLVKDMCQAASEKGEFHLPAEAMERLGRELTSKLQHPVYAKEVRKQAADARARGDSAYFLNPDLEVISRETNPVEYQPLFWRQFIDTEPLTPGATSFTYRMLDKAGIADVVDTLAGDAPDIDVFNTETTTGTKFIRDQFHWTIADLRSAALAQKPLMQDKRQAAMDAIERKLNDIAINGFPVPSVTTGLFGWRTLKENFNVAGMLESLTTGTWSGASAANILKDIAEIFDAISNNTKLNWGVFSGKPNLKLAVGHIHAQRLKSLQGPATGLHQSVWDAIMQTYGNIPGFEIVVIPELHDGAANGTDERVIGWHKDKRVISMPVAEYEEAEPHLEGWTYTIQAMASTTGVISRYPLGWCAADTAE